MAVPEWIKEHLDKHKVRFQEHHHRPAYTMQEVAAAEHVSGYHVAKVVVAIANDKRPVLLVLPAPNQVDIGLAKTSLGFEELRLATEPEIAKQFPDCEVGAVPPLKHWEGVEICMDRSMAHFGEFLFQAGTHEDAILMQFKDWLKLVEPRAADFARLAPTEA
jgi:Ala-tRNA(Pro) deacylase